MRELMSTEAREPRGSRQWWSHQNPRAVARKPGKNAGDATVCPPTDQRGFPRLGACDMGAYPELKP